MNSIWAFFLSTPEVREWHSETALTVIINLLTLNQTLATTSQVRKVFRERSILGLSVITIVFYAFYFLAFLIYGVNKGSLNMILSGAQFILYIPLVIGLWKHGGEEGRQKLRKLIPVFGMIPVIMLLIPWKETFLLCLFGGILITIGLMYRELKNIRGVGSVEIKFQFAFLANAIFWFFYGLSIHDMPLIIFNPLATILLVMMIVLYNQKVRGVHP